jgi:hypothetical protein
VNQQSAPFLLKLTLADWVQFQLGSNGITRASQPAPAFFFDDVTFGLKFHLVDQSDYLPSLSFSTTASVPTGAAEGYLRTYDLFLVGYATKDIGWLHAGLNLGANLWRVETPVSTQAWAALALSVQLPHGLGLMLEGRSLGHLVSDEEADTRVDRIDLVVLFHDLKPPMLPAPREETNRTGKQSGRRVCIRAPWA